MILNEWLQPFIMRFWISIKVVYLQRYLVDTWLLKLLLPWRTLCVHHATMHHGLQCPFMQSHIHRVHVCLALTCHLCFWQNVQDLLHATVVTWGWNRHQNGSQHGKLTPEKKIILPLSQICFKPRGKTVQNEQRWWLFPGWPWNVMINLPFPPWAGSRNSLHLTASMFSYVTLTHIQHHQGQTIH